MCCKVDICNVLHFWPTFLYNDVCLGFQKSAVLLDDFISTENGVWVNREQPVFDWMNLIRTKKGHTIVRSYIRKFLGYCFLKFLLYWNNKQLHVKQNILWVKLITSPDVNRLIVKSLTCFPIVVRLTSLRPDSGVYTLWVMK